MSLPASDSIPYPVAVAYLMFLGIFVLSFVWWVRTLIRIAAGEAVLPKPERRRIQPWGAIDVLIAVLLFFLLQVLGLAVVARLGLHLHEKPPSLSLHGWISLICCFATILSSLFIMLRCRIGEDDLGWSLARIVDDVRLGLTVFVMAVPPILILMVLVTKLSGVAYEHPVMEQAKRDPSLLVPALIMAVVCAPLTEEFAFRVLLQGFLEGFSAGRKTLERFFLGAVADLDHEAERLLPVVESVPWWPTVVAGSLFGLAHISYGASWLPLIAFGIVLGGLYRVTNRILPCLIVHASFNGLTMLMLSLHILYKLPVS